MGPLRLGIITSGLQYPRGMDQFVAVSHRRHHVKLFLQDLDNTGPHA